MRISTDRTRRPFGRRQVERLCRLLGDERGISLIFALLSMLVISTLAGGVAVYTTSDVHHSNMDRSSASAYQLAEAGLNHAISVLAAADDPRDSSLLPATTVQFPGLGGSATYSGDAVEANDEVTWTLTSTGTVGTSPARSHTLTQSLLVRGLVPGADLGSWSRFYQDSASRCLTIDTVNMPAPIATRGDLCLINGGSITGSATTVQAGANVYITGPTVSVGPRTATSTSGSGAWTSPASAYTSNNQYAFTSISPGSTSPNLVVSNFGFSLPSTAKILGVGVDIERKASGSGISDQTVYLRKNGAQVGNNEAYTGGWGGSSWPTFDRTQSYGGSSNTWGTTWTASDLNASNFGVQLSARNTTSGWGASTLTAYVDAITVTVYYAADTDGIGTSSTPIDTATVGGTCTYNGNPAHVPCTSVDHVWANNIVSSADTSDLVMPHPDFQYWFDNAMPGPKHFCTNSNNNLSPLVFDNDGSDDSNDSLRFDNSPTYDITPYSRDYDCQYVQNGVLKGEIGWNHTTHVMTVSGTIFFDGDVRFDDDGEIVHYHGRAIIYAAGAIEFDELVCAGGTGTTSCANPPSNMSNWDPSQNYLVLYGQHDSEYDQGGSNCSNMFPGATCAANGRHPQSGFQGVVSAQADCLIHEEFFLSGPVICNTISLPYETDGYPSYYPFPSLSDLVDGQKYGDIDTAASFELTPGPVTG
jgi:hypothetical protein